MAAIPTVFFPGIMLLVLVLDGKLQLKLAVAAWAFITAALTFSMEVGCVRDLLARRLSCQFCVWNLPRQYAGGLPIVGGAWATLAAAMHSWQAALMAAAVSAVIIVALMSRRTFKARRANCRRKELKVVRRSARAALEEALLDEDDIGGLQAAIEAYERMEANSIEEVSDKQGVLESARLELTERASKWALGLTLHLEPAGGELIGISATNISGDELASLQTHGDVPLLEVRRLIALEVCMLDVQVQFLLSDGRVLTDLAGMTVGELLDGGAVAGVDLIDEVLV